MAIGTAAALAGAAGAASGIGQGITQAVQGAQMFNKDDERRLNRLKALRRGGELGLSDVERHRLEGNQAVERGGMLRTQQAQQAAANAALANQQALSGREMFLASMAGQEAEAVLRGEQARAMAAQDMQARQQQLEEMNMLKEQERARKAAVRGGITQALTAGLFGAASGAAGNMYEEARSDEAYKRYEEHYDRMRAKGVQPSKVQLAQGQGWLSSSNYNLGTPRPTF